MADGLSGFMSDLAVSCAEFYNLESAARAYAATCQDSDVGEMESAYGVLLAAVLESKQSVSKALSSAETVLKDLPEDNEVFGTVQSCYGMLNDWRMRVGALDSNLKSIALDVSADYVDLIARSRANSPFTAPVITTGPVIEDEPEDDDDEVYEPYYTSPDDTYPDDNPYVVTPDVGCPVDDEPVVFVTEDPESSYIGDDEDYEGTEGPQYLPGVTERKTQVRQDTMSADLINEIRSIVLENMVEFMGANFSHPATEIPGSEVTEVGHTPGTSQDDRKGGFLGKRTTRAKRKGGDQ